MKVVALTQWSEACYGCYCTNPYRDVPLLQLEISEMFERWEALFEQWGNWSTLIKYFTRHHPGSLWWVWKTLLPSVSCLHLNSKAPVTPVYKPNRYTAQWQLLINKKCCYALWSARVFYLFMSAVVSFPLSMGEKGSKIIQIAVSLLMRSSANHATFSITLCCGYLQNRNRKLISNLLKGLWKITSTFTLPQLSSA